VEPQSHTEPDDDAPATDVARPWARYARDAADPGLRKDPANGQLQERSKGRYGTHIGTAVHETLQFVDLADPLAGLDELAAQAAANADVADADAVAALARSIVASDLFAELARARRVRREIYVGSTVGEGDAAITVWGYLDALFERDGKLVVVDFKTDSAANDVADLAERYGPQLSAYAAITAKATGMEVSDAYLLVARRNGHPATEVRVPITPVSIPTGSDPDPSPTPAV
jgi:ATP-dependent exoDNAse (exonuclease V) beta subunit